MVTSTDVRILRDVFCSEGKEHLSILYESFPQFAQFVLVSQFLVKTHSHRHHTEVETCKDVKCRALTKALAPHPKKEGKSGMLHDMSLNCFLPLFCGHLKERHSTPLPEPPDKFSGIALSGLRIRHAPDGVLQPFKRRELNWEGPGEGAQGHPNFGLVSPTQSALQDRISGQVRISGWDQPWQKPRDAPVFKAPLVFLCGVVSAGQTDKNTNVLRRATLLRCNCKVVGSHNISHDCFLKAGRVRSVRQFCHSVAEKIESHFSTLSNIQRNTNMTISVSSHFEPPRPTTTEQLWTSQQSTNLHIQVSTQHSLLSPWHFYKPVCKFCDQVSMLTWP